ncbi:acyltransferase [Microbacterium sp. LRZ72]|uniref:acyltransferase family protein n=1 Tax=Microbacterium sp. LRZ72 TaxID=2942481 RepID=UPI0029A971AF|nr:acyltransferase [Microbacterium sp. LRZ72]MDX2377015.1 acyltransferase [Microbacterium sp. LRZ72]
MTALATAAPIGRPKATYVPSLDGLRAVAVGTVMLAHAGVPGLLGGKTGVLLFFALSGFLITSILLREAEARGTISFRRFYARRFLRLLPAMLLVIAATVVFAAIVADQATMQRTPAALLYFINWTQVAGADAGLFSHYWSLAVEEQFYLVWPFLLVLLFRWMGRNGVVAGALLGAAISIGVKWLVEIGPGRHAGTDFAADALLLGCALAAASPTWSGRLGRASRVAFWPAVAAIGAALMLGNSGGAATAEEYAEYARIWWPISAVAATTVIAAFIYDTAPRWVRRILSLPPIVYLGRISYGMYLWHILVLAVVSSDLNPFVGLPARLVLTFGVTIALAALSFELVEKRFLLLKRRYESA